MTAKYQEHEHQVLAMYLLKPPPTIKMFLLVVIKWECLVQIQVFAKNKRFSLKSKKTQFLLAVMKLEQFVQTQMTAKEKDQVFSRYLLLPSKLQSLSTDSLLEHLRLSMSKTSTHASRISTLSSLT